MLLGVYFLASNSQRVRTELGNTRCFAFQANAKIALLRASMIVTYYIKFFRTGADRRNGILMSFLHLVAETINSLLIPSMILNNDKK